MYLAKASISMRMQEALSTLAKWINGSPQGPPNCPSHARRGVLLGRRAVEGLLLSSLNSILAFRSLSFCIAEEHPIGDITAPQARPTENMWAGAILLLTYT